MIRQHGKSKLRVKHSEWEKCEQILNTKAEVDIKLLSLKIIYRSIILLKLVIYYKYQKKAMS